MNVYSLTKQPYIRRLDVFLDRTYGFQTYGDDGDNLYPQRAEIVRDRSYTAKIAVEKTADFIYGKGFQDPALAKLVVNASRQTANKILNILSKDKALFTGFALHVKYNPFSYKIMEICPLEFSYCRLGIPDDEGNVTDIKYFHNWERDFNKTLHHVFDPQAYPVFNPDPAVVKAQIEEYGWDQYPGQILYWTPKPNVYPKCAFDPVFDDAQTQSEIGIFQLAGIQNKFTAQHIFKYPGKFETREKELEFKRELKHLTGAEANGSMMVVENPAGEAGQALDLIESVQMQNTDKMHEFTSKNVKNAIRESMAVPAPILGQLPENGMFNQEQIKEAYAYFNTVTAKHREEIAEVVGEILSYWNAPIAIGTTEIDSLVYGEETNKTLIEIIGVGGSQAMLAILTQYAEGKLTEEQTSNTLQILFGLSPEDANRMIQKQAVQPGATTAPGDPPAEQPINDNLKNLTGKQMQNIQRIVRKFNKGDINYDQAKEMLRSGFAFTDAQVDIWLVTHEEEAA
jgi:hypothetical protein